MTTPISIWKYIEMFKKYIIVCKLKEYTCNEKKIGFICRLSDKYTFLV